MSLRWRAQGWNISILACDSTECCRPAKETSDWARRLQLSSGWEVVRETLAGPQGGGRALDLGTGDVVSGLGSTTLLSGPQWL